VPNDLLDRTLLICDLPVDYYAGFMVREQVVPTVLGENRDGSAFLADQGERAPEFDDRAVHQLNSHALARVVQVTLGIRAELCFSAPKVGGKFAGPFLFQLTREQRDGEHAV
jgi:hypothetical protein